MLYVGIDTGVQGAIAAYDPDLHDLVLLADMPVDVVEINGKDRNRISRVRMLEILRPLTGAHAAVEYPEARPMKSVNKKDGTLTTRQPGAAGMLSFGMSYEAVAMGCVACGLILTEMRPPRVETRNEPRLQQR